MKSEINNWWKQSQADLKTTKNSLSSGDYYAAVFWCQQSVEKALKAVILKERKEILKLHDLVVLGKKANIPEIFDEKIKELTGAYTDSRYGITMDKIPAEEFNKESASYFIQFTEDILRWLEKKI